MLSITCGSYLASVHTTLQSIQILLNKGNQLPISVLGPLLLIPSLSERSRYLLLPKRLNKIALQKVTKYTISYNEIFSLTAVLYGFLQCM